jgi:hypothetical protein
VVSGAENERGPPSPDTSPHSLGGRVPGLICIDDHLAEGDVLSPRANGAGVREKTSIPQNYICPLDSIIAPPFSGIVLLLKSVHPDNDVVSRVAVGGRRALCEESASHGSGGGEGEAAQMEGTVDGVRGCIRLKGGASG